jgi:hypothetical protein
MSKTDVKTQVIRENNTARGARRIRPLAAGGARRPLTAAADGQIAEIERTFTARYEW